jgi:ATP-dependent DNA helicase RecG
MPYIHEVVELDWDAINQAFSKVDRNVTQEKATNLGLLTKHAGHHYPSYGGIILFGVNRLKQFPDAIIRCARFLGTTKAHIHDHADIQSYPTIALEEAIRFVERNTSMGAEIGRMYRTDIPEYPPIAVREAITNALLHADYAATGSTITIAIFDDRMEITNPGGLVFGLTLENALGGSSIIRNHVIAHTFRELKLIERWGSGLLRIIQVCTQRGLEIPKFEERNNEFRVTLYSKKAHDVVLDPAQKEFLTNLKRKEKISTKEAAEFWGIAPRNALIRLKQLTELGLIKRIGTSIQDPQSKYVLAKKDIPS